MLCLLLAACATPGGVESPGAAGGLADLVVRETIGLPSSLGLRMESSLGQALRGQSVAVAANPQSEARYRLQGFCSAAPADSGSSFVCVWDVTNRLDIRAQRVVTEQRVPGGTEANPWVGVSPAVVDDVAGQVASRVAGWLRSQGGTGQASTGLGSALSRLTGSRGRQTVAVREVTGAPGDGNRALLDAMREALRGQGLVVAPSQSSNYVVVARVQVSAAGQSESVAIDWIVTDAQGQSLGTISQRNQVPRGALQQSWGQAATDAANAAARGVRELLP